MLCAQRSWHLLYLVLGSYHSLPCAGLETSGLCLERALGFYLFSLAWIVPLFDSFPHTPNSSHLGG